LFCFSFVSDVTTMRQVFSRTFESQFISLFINIREAGS